MATLFAASTALAQSKPVHPEPLFDAAVARVRPGMTPHFYSDVTGCPAATAACRLPTYLVAGDLMLVGKAHGDFVEARFVNERGRLTLGFLERAAILPVRVQAPLSAWYGHWQREDAALDLTASPGGAVAFRGEALWRGMNDNVHVGDLDSKAVPVGDRIGPVDDSSTCRVAMRVAGPYLIVTDNGGCGGANVTFAGIYRRTGPAR